MKLENSLEMENLVMNSLRKHKPQNVLIEKIFNSVCNLSSAAILLNEQKFS